MDYIASFLYYNWVVIYKIYNKWLKWFWVFKLKWLHYEEQYRATTEKGIKRMITKRAKEEELRENERTMRLASARSEEETNKIIEEYKKD